MNAKQRVAATLSHTQPDRVPLDIGGINNSTMHHLIQTELKQRLGLKDNGTEIVARNQGVVVPDESLLDYFGADTRCIFVDEVVPWTDNGDGTLTDMWGVKQSLNPDGYYYNMCGHPLADAESIEEIEAYQFPEFHPRMLTGLKEKMERHADKCLILEGFRECLFGLPSWLRGIENFYMDLASGDEMCEALLDKVMDYILRMVDYAMEGLDGKGKIDVIKFADDMGTQTSMLLSPDTYREIIKPRAAKLYGTVKQKYGVKILLHACGAIRPIIGDLIEVGVDALNPVQISAADMEPASLKQEFGDKVTFWGGGIDTQSVLNLASPAEVKKQVAANMAAFKPGGGYIFCQVHNIMPGVPVDNIIAMYEAYRENAAY